MDSVGTREHAAQELDAAWAEIDELGGEYDEDLVADDFEEKP